MQDIIAFTINQCIIKVFSLLFCWICQERAGQQEAMTMNKVTQLLRVFRKKRHVSRKRWQDLLVCRIRFYVYSAALCLLLAHILASFWYPFEWVTHFTLHITLFIVSCSCLLAKYWRLASFCLCMMICIFAILPFDVSTDRQNSRTKTVTVLSYNLNFENEWKTEEIDCILRTDPDIALLMEVGGAVWHHPLETLKKRYPHSCAHSTAGPFGIQLLAKQPLIACEVKFSDIYPFLRAVLPDQQVLFALHPPPPVNQEMAEQRKRYFRETAEHIKAEQQPVLVLGDFNNTPYSPLYRHFAASARVRDALPHALPTWKPFFLPIDRVMYRHCRVSVRALAWQHSDHRPLLVAWQSNADRK